MHYQLIQLLPILMPLLTLASSRRCPSLNIIPPSTFILRQYSHRINGNKLITNSCRPTNGHYELSDGIIDSSDKNANDDTAVMSSHIASITSTNMANLKNSNNNNSSDRGITIQFASDAGLIAITGESGSGKSVLVCKAIDLISGGKAMASLLPSASKDADGSLSEACVEVVINLFEPHLSAVSSSLQHYGVDPKSLLSNGGQLHLSRTIQHHVSDNTTNTPKRIKSTCRINGKHVSLKTLRSVSSPLFARVDIATASAALNQPHLRLGMIDTGVSLDVKRECRARRDEYDKAKRRRRQIEKQLKERVLPVGMMQRQQRSSSGDGSDDEEDMELLRHWVDELDQFEFRVNAFRETILRQYNELLSENQSVGGGKQSYLNQILHNLQTQSWDNNHQSDNSEDASLFASLLEFREEVKALETQLTSAQYAYELLTSLSAPESASVAIDKVRKTLYDISRNDNTGPLFDSIEKTHELLNEVEAAINNCARSIDGNSNSVLSTLESMVCTGISLEEINTMIADWNALARKHGISSWTLPNCHQSLRQELDGNVEARMLLPDAKREEELALKEYVDACKQLSYERKEVAETLSKSVTELLPSLGLESSTFQVQMGLRQGGFKDPYCGTDGIGVDTADFFLRHQKAVSSPSNNDRETNEAQQGGFLGSSGEKSRVLLAIETCLPGSIGASCNSAISENTQYNSDGMPPIAIIYDEIDAHVGGRAAVTVARLLAEQTRKQSKSGSRIIAITHSASVAAIADQHIVIERISNRDEGESPSLQQQVRAFVVDGQDRSREIARMTSGDLALGEAEAFADALIRDASLQKEIHF